MFLSGAKGLNRKSCPLCISAFAPNMAVKISEMQRSTPIERHLPILTEVSSTLYIYPSLYMSLSIYIPLFLCIYHSLSYRYLWRSPVFSKDLLLEIHWICSQNHFMQNHQVTLLNVLFLFGPFFWIVLFSHSLSLCLSFYSLWSYCVSRSDCNNDKSKFYVRYTSCRIRTHDCQWRRGRAFSFSSSYRRQAFIAGR